MEEDVHADEPADHLRGQQAPVCSGALQAINSHFLLPLPPLSEAHQFFSWASAGRGHRLSIRSKAALVSGDLVPALLPAADMPSRTHRAAPASLRHSFKAFAPGKQDKNGSGFSQYANISSVPNHPGSLHSL